MKHNDFAFMYHIADAGKMVVKRAMQRGQTRLEWPGRGKGGTASYDRQPTPALRRRTARCPKGMWLKKFPPNPGAVTNRPSPT